MVFGFLTPCRGRLPVDPWREAPPAPPLGELLNGREAEGVRLDEWGRYEPTHDTLSVSPFGLPALPEGEPRALRANRRALPAIAFKKLTLIYEESL